MIIPTIELKKKLLTTIIAPHGITDLIHAKQNNKLHELISINSVSVLTSYGLYQNDITNIISNSAFIGFSIIHFSHDFLPIIENYHEKKQKMLLCSLFIALSIFNNNLFFLYMVLIHVPKHYFYNRYFLKKYLIGNLSFIFIFSLLLGMAGQHNFVFDERLYPLYKGIITSHIIYQERYIHNN